MSFVNTCWIMTLIIGYIIMLIRLLSADISLEDQLANIGVSFHDKLFELIDESHLDNKDVWKRANLDRKHFQKFNVTRIIIQRRRR